MEFIKKNSKESQNRVPIRITTTYSKATNKHRYRVSLRDGIENKITSTGLIMLAFYGEKIYMAQENDKKKGYAITKYSSYTCAFKFPYFEEGYEGDYELKYDKEQKLYYAEKIRGKA